MSKKFKFDLIQDYFKISVLILTLIECVENLPSEEEIREHLKEIGLEPKKVFPKPINGILENTKESLEKRTEGLFNAYYQQFEEVAQTMQESTSFIVDMLSNIDTDQLLYFQATYKALDKEKLDGTIKITGNSYLEVQIQVYTNLISHLITNEGITHEEIKKHLQEQIKEFKKRLK